MTRRDQLKASLLALFSHGVSAAACPSVASCKLPGPNVALLPKPLRLPYLAIDQNSPDLFHSPLLDSIAALPSPATLPLNAVERLSVAALTAPANSRALALLQLGYGLFRAATTTPAGFQAQGMLHRLYCEGGAHESANGRFLAWHRAFVYFQERLLRWHLEKAQVPDSADVRIPYWDVPRLNEPLGVYASFSQLSESCRRLTDLSDSDIKDAVKSVQAGIDVADIFNCSQFLYAWHVKIHARVGGFMGCLAWAGFDPIFCAVHAEVDRVWSLSAAHGQPTEDVWCAFYDPYLPGWVRVNLSDFSSFEKLGYRYA